MCEALYCEGKPDDLDELDNRWLPDWCCLFVEPEG